MAIPTLRRVRSQDNTLRQLQDASDNVFKAITSKRILDGNLIEDIVITGGEPKTIDHLLGRKLTGWILVRKNLEVDVWDSQSDNPTPSATLVLNSTDNSADPMLENEVTISLWVF